MTDKTSKIEQHPLPPFFPAGAKVLMLGSFPPPRARWKMDFYYPNFQNDMWRIFGLVFFEEKDYFLTDDKKSYCEARIRSFLTEKGIAFSDTAREVIRQKDNASDKFLEVVSVIRLDEVLSQLPDCRAIVTTGKKPPTLCFPCFRRKNLKSEDIAMPYFGDVSCASTACLPLPGLTLSLFLKKLPSMARCSVIWVWRDLLFRLIGFGKPGNNIPGLRCLGR